MCAVVVVVGVGDVVEVVDGGVDGGCVDVASGGQTRRARVLLPRGLVTRHADLPSRRFLLCA